MRKLLTTTMLLLLAVSAFAQQIAGDGKTGPAGSVIGYNSADSNWLYVPTDANGYLMVDCMSGCSGGGGGSPGGSTTQAQFNNAGSFAGSSAFLFDTGTGVPSKFQLSNAGIFTSGQANLYGEFLVGGCDPATEYNTVQNNHDTEGLTGCTQGTFGSSTHQITGVSGFATTLSSSSVSVGGYFQGRALANNTGAFGGNWVAQDVSGLTTGVVLTNEVDIQPLNPPSAYAAGAGIAIDLYNNNNQNGTYPFNGISFAAISPNGGQAFWGNGIDFNVGALGGSGTAIDVNANGTATSGANQNCPTLLNAYEAYWNGSASAFEGWAMGCNVGSGTNPNVDTFFIGHAPGTTPSGQTHTLELQNGIQLKLDGSTSGSTTLSATATGGTLNLGSTLTTVDSAGEFAMTLPGTFSNTASSFPNQTLLNGCNLQTIFSVPQFTSYLTSAVSGCAASPTNNPGSAYNQTTGGFFAATASGLGSGSGTSRAVGVSPYAIITGNNTLAYGANPLVEDFADSATGQQLKGMEVDVQPQKLPSAYNNNGVNVLGIQLQLYNQAGTGGTFGPALAVGATSFGTSAFWKNLITSGVGALGGGSVAINVNAQGTAISGSNFNCPTLLNAYEQYWNGSAAVSEGWSMGCNVASGTNPTTDNFQVGHAAGTAPTGQAHTWEFQNGIKVQLDGSTSGSAVLSVAATGGTLSLGSANATVDQSGNMTVASCSGCGANIAGGALGSFPYQSAPGVTSLLPPNTTTNTFCLTETGDGTNGAAPILGSCAGSASTAWSALSPGTNTAGAFVIGTAGSLATTGTGTIAATSLSTFYGNSYAGTTTGSVNTMAATLSPAPASLTAMVGVPVTFLPNNSNTTTTPTVNFNSFGAETVVKCGSTALAAGDISTTADAVVMWNGTNMVLQNPQAAICQSAVAGNLTIGNNLLLGSAFGTAVGTGTLVSGGQNGSSAGTTGGLTLTTGNNTSTGGAGPVLIRPGTAVPATSTQGSVIIEQSFYTASALSSTFNVVSMTTTSDEVVAAAPGAVNNIGIAQTVGGTTTQLYVATGGKTTVRFDGTPVIGDEACAPPASTGTTGLAHDNVLVACPAKQTLGIITGQVSGSGSGATATVLLQMGS